MLRDVTKNQTNPKITGNSPKIELAYTLVLVRLIGNTNQDLSRVISVTRKANLAHFWRPRLYLQKQGKAYLFHRLFE